MMLTEFRRCFFAALSASFLLALSGCGGGGGEGGAGTGGETAFVSGYAVKGPIKGAAVQVFRLKPDGTRDELLGSGSTGEDGFYSVAVPGEKALPPLLVTVSGRSGATYRSETTGGDVGFGAGESFSALLDSYEAGRRYTVGPLTEIAYQQLQKFLTLSPASAADSRVVGAANARVARLFNVADILGEPAAEPAYQAALAVIDQMIRNSANAGGGGTLPTMSLINQGVADVTTPAYQSYRTALVQAAGQVTARQSSLSSAVNALLATAAEPPAEPDWSDTTAPQTVAGLKGRAAAESASAASVTLSWSAAATAGKNPVAGYEIYRNGKRIAAVASLTFLDQPLALSTAYRYRVAAFDAAGNRSALSAELTLTTPAAPNLTVNVGGQLSPEVTALPFKDITAPSVPLNLTASSSAIDAATSSVALRWDAAADAVAVTGYDLFRDGVRIGSTSQPRYTDAPVASGKTYSYTVVAFDAAGNRSLASAPLPVTLLAPNLGINVGGQLDTGL